LADVGAGLEAGTRSVSSVRSILSEPLAPSCMRFVAPPAPAGGAPANEPDDASAGGDKDTLLTDIVVVALSLPSDGWPALDWFIPCT